MRYFFPRSFFTALLSLVALPSLAGDAIYTGTFSNKALSGYDPVAYFTEGKPVKGNKEHTLNYLGADWYFNSAENKALFEADPDAYAPQYGGFCAWAVSAKNSRAPGDPERWKIVDGKLYLNYNTTVQNRWLEDVSGHISQADKNWPVLLED